MQVLMIKSIEGYDVHLEELARAAISLADHGWTAITARLLTCLPEEERHRKARATALSLLQSDKKPSQDYLVAALWGGMPPPAWSSINNRNLGLLDRYRDAFPKSCKANHLNYDGIFDGDRDRRCAAVAHIASLSMTSEDAQEELHALIAYAGRSL